MRACGPGATIAEGGIVARPGHVGRRSPRMPFSNDARVPRVVRRQERNGRSATATSWHRTRLRPRARLGDGRGPSHRGANGLPAISMRSAARQVGSDGPSVRGDHAPPRSDRSGSTAADHRWGRRSRDADPGIRKEPRHRPDAEAADPPGRPDEARHRGVQAQGPDREVCLRLARKHRGHPGRALRLDGARHRDAGQAALARRPTLGASRLGGARPRGW